MSSPLTSTRTAGLYPYLRELALDDLHQILQSAPRASDEDRYWLAVVESELEFRASHRAGGPAASREPSAHR
jgi:hypothetical protein